jgi:DNA-binding NarL/FixJ family response regulator
VIRTYSEVMFQAMRLLIVDDHVAARTGLRLRLKREPDLAIVGEAADIRQAEELAAQHAPDVVLVDMSLPDGDGLELVDRLRGVVPTTRCVILTLDDSVHVRRRAHTAGVTAVVGKHEPTAVLLRAIREGR